MPLLLPEARLRALEQLPEVLERQIQFWAESALLGPQEAFLRTIRFHKDCHALPSQATEEPLEATGELLQSPLEKWPPRCSEAVLKSVEAMFRIHGSQKASSVLKRNLWFF